MWPAGACFSAIHATFADLIAADVAATTLFSPSPLPAAASPTPSSRVCHHLPTCAAYTKFMAIQADDREDLVRRVARYSVLTYCSGSSGVIEEASIIKDALGGRSDAHPRLLLLAAAPLLRRTLAIEPVQVLKAPIKEDFEYANKGHVPTKLAPAWVLRRTIGDEGGPHVADVCSRNAAVASASVDGLTAAQRGLLGVVLCLLLLEPAKALREDRLWHLLQQLDSERFALGENKAGEFFERVHESGSRLEPPLNHPHASKPTAPSFSFASALADVVRMGEAAAEAEACRPGAGLHPAADGAGTRTAASAPLDRSLLDWRTVISRDFVRLGYLWRRSAESEGLFEETDDLSAPPGSKTEAQGDRKTAYRLGPRARHTVGAPALLSVIEQLSGASYTKDEVRANLGVEWAGVDVAASAAGDFFDAKQRAADDARHKRMRAFEQPSVEGEQPGSTAGGPRKSRR